MAAPDTGQTATAALLDLQGKAGNRAVAALIGGRTGSGVVQREPAAAAAGTAHQSPQFKDYAELINDFGDLAAAAIDQGGRGLDSKHLGAELSSKHRALLESVRHVLILAQEQSPDSKHTAAAQWPGLAAKLHQAFEEAKPLGIPQGSIAGANDVIDLISHEYVHATKGPTEEQQGEDLSDTFNAIQALVWTFERMGEGSVGLGRERVQGREDVQLSKTLLELNAKQRDKLNEVKIGPHASERHHALVEALRSSLLLVRSEGAGSAAQAFATWTAIESELRQVLAQSEGKSVEEMGQKLTTLGREITEHYEIVHKEEIGVALKAEAQPGRAEAEHAAGLADPEAQAAMQQEDAFADFKHALEIIERGIAPLPNGEFLLTSGKTQIRVRADEVAQLRAIAKKELHDYMADLARRMSHAALTYEDIKRDNGSFKLHVLGGWGGASDPGSQMHYRDNLFRIRDTIVFPEIENGELVKAFEMILNQKAIVEEHVKEVGDYDADLDIGYSRLNRSMQVVQVALAAIVPVAGEAAIAGGASVFVVGGTAMATGAGAAAGAEAGRELIAGEGLQGSKIAGAGRGGLAVGATAFAPAATKALGTTLAAGETPGVAALAGETGAGMAVNAGIAAAGGGDVGTAAIGGGAGTIVGKFAAGAQAVTGSKAVGAVTAVGGGAGAAYVTGGDPIAGGIGGVSGLAAGHADGVQPTVSAPAQALPEAVPVPIESDPTYIGPAPSDGVPVAHPGMDTTGAGPSPYENTQPVPENVPVPVPEDPTYIGPAPSDGVPEAIPGMDSTATTPSPYENTSPLEQQEEPVPEPSTPAPAPAAPGPAPVPAAVPEPVRDWSQAIDLGDLSGRPLLSSVGDKGSVSTAGGGVFEVTLPDGTKAVAKMMPDMARRRAGLEQELKGAYQASRTGIGGRAYGVARAVINGQPKIGIVMERAEGGFISVAKGENWTAADLQAATDEAAHWRSKVNDETVASLEAYRSRLLANGQYYSGELQFFVDENGQIRPIDFQGLHPLPTDPVERQEAIESHNADFDRQREALEAIAKENAAKQRSS